jgi:endogenous inhibitor of DNA gyrase (YacG/DUF329 family)
VTRKRQPLECTLCGLPMQNDENARWSPEPDREPFCSDGCMALANAEYVWDGDGRDERYAEEP